METLQDRNVHEILQISPNVHSTIPDLSSWDTMRVEVETSVKIVREEQQMQGECEVYSGG
jgi:hypothetical protein